MVLIVAAVGRSGSGKTVTIEYLVRQLSVEGFKVGVVKHVHHRGFTIDTEGKNTWRYAQAGAKVVVAISPDEVAIIRKVSPEVESLDNIIEVLERDDSLDIIFIEGYHDLVAHRGDMLKIVTAIDVVCLQEVLEGMVEPVLAVSGLIAKKSDCSFIQKYPVIKIPEEGKTLVDLIKQHMMIKMSKLREGFEVPKCDK
ncbi:MAG: molybdopterin-guanine dinucleotide biosynthesis protein B [Candidatus Bathyarchaeota archaeon]|nr:molybdopterin-guanine dinucleotide biosynthesis protein B [Candidatus Termiticorpusculum sp.]